MADFPRTAEDIAEDSAKRRAGLLRALTEEADALFEACDPEKENLCLYGLRDGNWMVGPPAEEVPPELPEPCLGINFARDAMPRKDWLALVAVHSDAWLFSVAFFYGVKLDGSGRGRLFKLLNSVSSLFESVTSFKAATALKPEAGAPPLKRFKTDRPFEAPFRSGRLMKEVDLTQALKGRQAELFWPDDAKWYLVEIQSVNLKTRQAKIVYASGEFEDVDLEEIVRDGHMALLF
ncbi:hypothetical protein V8C86DRAFT_1807728 [Haematococcus lacustris]